MKKPSFKIPQVSFGVITRLGLAAPLALAVAIGATTIAGVEAANLIKKAQPAPIAKADIQSKALTAAEYGTISQKLADISTSVKVTAGTGGGGVVLAVDNANAWPELVYTIAALSTVDGSVLWSFKSLCINTCPGEPRAVHRAILTGVRQSLEIGKSEEKVVSAEAGGEVKQ